jgi:hypothetical protein
VRGYAGGGGLNKEEVEGRIKGLLAGFDKVCCATVRKPGRDPTARAAGRASCAGLEGDGGTWSLN